MSREAVHASAVEASAHDPVIRTARLSVRDSRLPAPQRRHAVAVAGIISGGAVQVAPAGSSTNYVYDGLNGAEEQNSSGSATGDMLGGGLDNWMTRTDSSGTNTMLADGRNSTVGLVNSSGSLATQFSYEPFGRTTFSGSGTSNLYRFAGRELDATGLYFMRARYYNPILQRFLSPDPGDFAGGNDPNLYAYAHNNPLNFIDPLGTEAISISGIGGIVPGDGLGGPDYPDLSLPAGAQYATGYAELGDGAYVAFSYVAAQPLNPALTSLPTSLSFLSGLPGLVPGGMSAPVFAGPSSGAGGMSPVGIMPVADMPGAAPVPSTEATPGTSAPPPPGVKPPATSAPNNAAAANCVISALASPLIIAPVLCVGTGSGCLQAEAPGLNVSSCRVAAAFCAATAAIVAACKAGVAGPEL